MYLSCVTRAFYKSLTNTLNVSLPLLNSNNPASVKKHIPGSKPPYFGLHVTLAAYSAAETGGQQPAEGKIQEEDILPEEVNSHQGEQTTVWVNRQRAS